jgi:hypothetical protein
LTALSLKILTERLLYWDDTVIFINTIRACFRFYGNESIAFYTAHMEKGLKGLKEDNVLPLLTGDTKAMHDQILSITIRHSTSRTSNATSIWKEIARKTQMIPTTNGVLI